jgi:serine phosphatase RsbU (regulator of sigma subunit)
VAVLDATGDTLEVVRAAGYPIDMVERFGRIDLAAPVPLADAARKRRPVSCCDLDEWGRRYPALVPHAPDTAHQAATALPLVVDDRLLGAIGLSFDEPQRFDTAHMEFLEAVAAQCAQALDRAWSYMAEADARRSAEAAGARLAFLAEASGILAASMEYETTLPAVAALAIRVLGQCCAVHVIEPNSRDAVPRWKLAAVAHTHPSSERRLADIPASAWQQAATGTSRVEALRELGVRSVIGVPLLARGRTLGVLSLGRTSTEPFSAADRSLATDLGARVAQAVDNAMLYRAERQAHQEAETAAVRLRFLLDVSTTLASPLALQPRLERLARQSVESLSDVCVIDLVEPDGSVRRVAAAAANPAVEPLAGALSAGVRLDPSSRHPVVAAVEHRRTELLVDLTDDDLRAMTGGPDALRTARETEPLSCVAVPLLAGSRALGAITLLTTARSGRRYGPTDLIFVEDVARRVAMGLESARMHEEMRRVAQTLQASLLPSVPPGIPGLEVGTRYLAAGEGTVVGGDFFDVFALGPDSWAVVVGDVCGKGVEAATVTGLARHTVRSSAMEHTSPATVLRHLNDMLLRVGAEGGSEVEPRFCTVCLARVELTDCGASVTLSMGGHPLPYVLGAGGDIRQVGRPGSLLGVVDKPSVSDETHHLGPGESFILYTDGITERHTGGKFFGEEGIEDVLAAAAGLTADEIAGHLADAAGRFVNDQPSDDMAVVVVRVPPR